MIILISISVINLQPFRQLTYILIIAQLGMFTNSKPKNRLTLHQNRDNLRIQRLLKFIHANSPVSLTMSNQNCKKESERTEKTKQIGSGKQKMNKLASELSIKMKQSVRRTKINEVINSFVSRQKQLNPVKRQSRSGSEFDHIQIKNRVHSQTKSNVNTIYTSSSKINSNRLTNTKFKQESMLPLIKAVKTQQTNPKIKHAIDGKTYESLLFLPIKAKQHRIEHQAVLQCVAPGDIRYKNTQMLNTEQQNGQNNESENRNPSSKKNSITLYTGWQTTEELKQYEEVFL